MANSLKKDANSVAVSGGVSDLDLTTILPLLVDHTTGRLLCSASLGAFIGPGYTATSTTSLTIGIGSQSLTTQTGLAYTAGARIRLSSSANSSNYIEGIVTTYNSGTGALVFTADYIGGSGTYADWNINLTGDVGATGPQGIQGIQGATGPIGMNWTGAYNAGTAYNIHDGVSYNGSSYICILASTGNVPTNATYWSVLALKGTDGTGTGDFVGPASSIANNIVTFADTTGKLGKDSGYSVSSLALSVPSTDVYVDGNRVDSYTADGTIGRPYKTIHDAIAPYSAYTTPLAFHIAPATTYTESGDLTLPNAPIVVYGNGSTISNSGHTITIPNPNFVIYNLWTTSNIVYNNFSAGARCAIYGGGITGNITVNSYAEFIQCQLTGGVVTIGATGQCVLSICSPTSRFVSAGILIFNGVNMNTGYAGYLITSTAGMLTFANSIIYNTNVTASSGGVSCDNGATITAPNMIVNNSIITAGGDATHFALYAGTAYTMYSKNNVASNPTTYSLYGTNLIPVSSDIIGGSVAMGLGSDATGDVYYRNASGLLARLAVGTSSQALIGGTVPSFGTPWTAMGYLTSLSGALLATGATTGATSQAQTLTNGVILSNLTVSTLVGADASKKIISLDTATYPSLTELSYVKGLSSAIQTQLGAKLPLAGGTMTGKVTNAGRDEAGKIYTPASGSQTVALDCSVNNMHFVTCNDAGTAITFTITGATNNQPFIVNIKQGATTLSTIASWFSGVSWVGGTAPTFTATLGKTDTFGFIRTGSNTYQGYIIGQNI